MVFMQSSMMSELPNIDLLSTSDSSDAAIQYATICHCHKPLMILNCPEVGS